ncbi:MAG: MFS transporter [Bryobacterales bacterium]|nr:MFS transporter [Bryobacterales bacterium]
MQAVSESQHRPARQPRVGLGVKLAYAAGEIVNSMKLVIFGLYSLFFATTVLHLPGRWIGAVGFLTILWDAIIDPCIGYITDGTHAARRFTFMVTGAFTMGMGFWAFFSPPAALPPVLLLLWLAVASFVVRSATSLFTIPYCAVGVNLTEDYSERNSITGIRTIIGGLGTLLTASLSFVVFFPEKTPGVDPKLNPAGYSAMGFSFGLVMTAAAAIALWSVAPLRRRLIGTPPATERQAPALFFRGAWECLRQPSFRLVVIASSLAVMALAVNSSLMIHYLKYYVEADGSAVLSGAQSAYFCSGLVAMLFWLKVSGRFEKHKLYAFSTIATAALIGSVIVLLGKGRPLGTGDARWVLLGNALAGLFSSVGWFLSPSMLADVADEIELTTGKRREGVLFGMLSFSHQTATGLAIMLAGVLLDLFIRLAPGGAQSPATVERIGLVYSVVPAALLCAAGIAMLRYRLTRARVTSIQAELWERRGLTAEAAAAPESAAPESALEPPPELPRLRKRHMTVTHTDFITVVSGLPRSGTSMTMRMLEQGGLPALTDGFRQADEDNPLGYFEFEAVKRLDKDASWLRGAGNKAVKVIYIFLYQLPVDYKYKVIFIRRNLDEVVASQKAMLRRRKEGDRLTDEQLMASYQAQLEKLDLWLRRQENFSVLYLHYSDVVERPLEAAEEIERFLGVPLDTQAMAQAVDPSLHRNRSAAV